MRHVDDFQFEFCRVQDMNAGDMREILSSDVAIVLRRLGGVL